MRLLKNYVTSSPYVYKILGLPREIWPESITVDKFVSSNVQYFHYRPGKVVGWLAVINGEQWGNLKIYTGTKSDPQIAQFINSFLRPNYVRTRKYLNGAL